jgi:hypothetical protein
MNSGRMKSTALWFAKESRNMTTRFPDEIIEPSVGQANVSDGVELKEGTNARSAIPEELKSFPHVVTFTPSGFVNRIVKTENQRVCSTIRTFIGICVQP